MTPHPQLPRGARLGPFEVVAPLGVGGMGEVYRARDTKLGREVAIKILPTIFTKDAERRARLEREAHVLAALNHPNVGAIYGFEESGNVSALVLELIEGPTLADRLAQGALPVTDALEIAMQITAALEAAHEKGIIHRDLKPANIKLRPDGAVKVLDFGIAKVVAGDVAGDGSASDLSRPLALTGQEGVILGTLAYMSPEQARGKAADKRTDVWAFGCVLYRNAVGAARVPACDDLGNDRGGPRVRARLRRAAAGHPCQHPRAVATLLAEGPATAPPRHGRCAPRDYRGPGAARRGRRGGRCPVSSIP